MRKIESFKRLIKSDMRIVELTIRLTAFLSRAIFSKIAVYSVFFSINGLAFVAQSQSSPENLVKTGSSFYRSKNNFYYWKNRKPYDGYWQQDVYYNIKATIDDHEDIISGVEQFTYWNNSPDTLLYVYFHLYQNAFLPGSYLDELTKADGGKPNYSKWELEKKGTAVEKIQSNGNDLKTELDNTILKVYLSKPLLPNDSTVFDISFKTYYGSGSIHRRMALFNVFGFKHYNGAQWYPKISVYDHKFGWTADQHFNHEFYGDFGAFDVELTFPNNYVLDATGVLMNEKEVLPDSLRRKLDISNFRDKPVGSPPSLIIAPDGTKKTWNYHADNVHDFAFTADPTYRIGEYDLHPADFADGTKGEWHQQEKTIRCIALVQEPNAAKWQNAAEYAGKIIQTYSNDIGLYGWPKIIVSDARDGMEYPMLTMDGGLDPSYRGLLCHEIGHEWFYGMVGNNETYRALLDEGFTQFLTSWSLTKLEGTYGLNYKQGNKYIDRYRDSVSVRFRTVYSDYLREAIRGDDGLIKTHSDYFENPSRAGGGYRMVYRKTATMLYNLQYVLGDSLFLAAMQHYFHQWQFCHPYVEDFRNSMIQFTHVDLNWFFDQWLETDKRIDYAIKSINNSKEKDDFTIIFKRKERMQMPIDFSVYANDGKVYSYHIPNRDFVKKTNATVLPKWTGWDKLNPEYKANVHIPTGIESVLIDTTLRLADINMLNNTRPFPVRLRFDSKVDNPSDFVNYTVHWRPDVWYNNYDGVKAGLHLDGGYADYSHFADFNFWLNTSIGQAAVPDFADINKHDPASFTFSYRTPTDKLLFKYSSVFFNARLLDGLQHISGGIDWTSPRGTTLNLSFLSDYRRDQNATAYLLYPDEWGIGSYDNVLKAEWQQHYSYSSGSGVMSFSVRSSSIGSNYNYSYLTLSFIDQYRLAKFILRTRAFFQYGTGKDFAKESSLYLAGANGEELMNDKFTRARAFVPQDWLGYGDATNHFQQGGGLNLRGYAGYFVTQPAADGSLRYIYRGTSGGAMNAEFDFASYIKLRPAFTRKWLSVSTYLFGDAGSINYDLPQEKLTFSDIRTDAGIGITATIKKFGPLQTVKPFTLRIDFPLWLNRPPAAEDDFVRMRYVVGVGKSF